MNVYLYQLDNVIKKFLTGFLIALTLGVLVGLTYLWYTTDYTPKGTVERFNGSISSDTGDEFAIPENYPKPVSELLVTTHNHIITFSLIFLALGSIFFFNSIISGWWKTFFLIEPFVSTVVSFSTIWGIRFIHSSFVYVTIISAVLIYSSFFIMSFICLYELNLKKG